MSIDKLESTKEDLSGETPGVITDNDELVSKYVAYVLPSVHREAVVIILRSINQEIDKPGSSKLVPGEEDPTKLEKGGRRRRMKGGDVTFTVKCLILALIEIIVDGVSAAPKLAIEGAVAGALVTGVVTQYTGAAGAAAAASFVTAQVYKIYYSFTNVGQAALGAEAAAAAQAAAYDPGADEEIPVFVPLVPPKSFGGTALTDLAGEPMTQAQAWMNTVSKNPEVAGSMPKAPDGSYPMELIQKVVIAVVIAVYLKKLHEVVTREKNRDQQRKLLDLQIQALEAPKPAQPPSGVVKVRNQRRKSVAKVAMAILDAPPPAGGRRSKKTRRHRRHRLSAPTRKVRHSSYGGRKRYSRQRRV